MPKQRTHRHRGVTKTQITLYQIMKGSTVTNSSSSRDYRRFICDFYRMKRGPSVSGWAKYTSGYWSRSSPIQYSKSMNFFPTICECLRKASTSHHNLVLQYPFGVMPGTGRIKGGDVFPSHPNILIPFPTLMAITIGSYPERPKMTALK